MATPLEIEIERERRRRKQALAQPEAAVADVSATPSPRDLFQRHLEDEARANLHSARLERVSGPGGPSHAYFPRATAALEAPPAPPPAPPVAEPNGLPTGWPVPAPAPPKPVRFAMGAAEDLASLPGRGLAMAGEMAQRGLEGEGVNREEALASLSKTEGENLPGAILRDPWTLPGLGAGAVAGTALRGTLVNLARQSPKLAAALQLGGENAAAAYTMAAGHGLDRAIAEGEISPENLQQLAKEGFFGTLFGVGVGGALGSLRYAGQRMAAPAYEPLSDLARAAETAKEAGAQMRPEVPLPQGGTATLPLVPSQAARAAGAEEAAQTLAQAEQGAERVPEFARARADIARQQAQGLQQIHEAGGRGEFTPTEEEGARSLLAARGRGVQQAFEAAKATASKRYETLEEFVLGQPELDPASAAARREFAAALPGTPGERAAVMRLVESAGGDPAIYLKLKAQRSSAAPERPAPFALAQGGPEAKGRGFQFGFETAPPPGEGGAREFSGLLSEHQRLTAPLGAAGENAILKHLDIIPSASFEAGGLYKGDVSPNTRYEFAVPEAEAAQNELARRLSMAAEAHRDLYGQEAVGFYRPLPADADAAAGVALDIGRPLTPEELRGLSERVAKALGRPLGGGSPTRLGMDFFGEEGVPHQKLEEAVAQAADELGLTGETQFFALDPRSKLVNLEEGAKLRGNQAPATASSGSVFDLLPGLRQRIASARGGEGAGPSPELPGPGGIGPRPRGLDLAALERKDPEAGRAVFARLGLKAAGKNTLDQLKIYPLDAVTGGDLPRTQKLIDDWLAREGWSYRVFGNQYGPPKFKEASYPQKTVWIFDPAAAHGSFKDTPYTLLWRVSHEVAHGETDALMTQKFGGQGRRQGALGIETEFQGRKVPPLSLADALRAVEWEDAAFRRQREILEKNFGVKISDAEFAKENALNLGDATYRVLTGDFSDPDVLGIVPRDVNPVATLNAARKTLIDVAKERGLPLTETFGEAKLAQRDLMPGAPLKGEYQPRGRVATFHAGADISTAVHELLGHDLEATTLSPVERRAIAQDLKGVVSGPIVGDGGKWTTAAKEQVARWMETLLHGGLTTAEAGGEPLKPSPLPVAAKAVQAGMEKVYPEGAPSGEVPERTREILTQKLKSSRTLAQLPLPRYRDLGTGGIRLTLQDEVDAALQKRFGLEPGRDVATVGGGAVKAARKVGEALGQRNTAGELRAFLKTDLNPRLNARTGKLEVLGEEFTPDPQTHAVLGEIKDVVHAHVRKLWREHLPADLADKLEDVDKAMLQSYAAGTQGLKAVTDVMGKRAIEPDKFFEAMNRRPNEEIQNRFAALKKAEALAPETKGFADEVRAAYREGFLFSILEKTAGPGFGIVPSPAKMVRFWTDMPAAAKAEAFTPAERRLWDATTKQLRVAGFADPKAVNPSQTAYTLARMEGAGAAVRQLKDVWTNPTRAGGNALVRQLLRPSKAAGEYYATGSVRALNRALDFLEAVDALGGAVAKAGAAGARSTAEEYLRRREEGKVMGNP